MEACIVWPAVCTEGNTYYQLLRMTVKVAYLGGIFNKLVNVVYFGVLRFLHLNDFLQNL